MAGITTIDSLLYRVALVLRQYHATEVALIDTRNNALATSDGYTANNFTSPTLASADVQVHRDTRTGITARCVVAEVGDVTYSREFHYDNEGAASTMPRVDRTFRLEIEWIVNSDGGVMAGDGAKLRCNRLADACVVTLGKYPLLSVPASALDPLPMGPLTLRNDGLAKEQKTDDTSRWRRALVYDAQLFEHRA